MNSRKSMTLTALLALLPLGCLQPGSFSFTPARNTTMPASRQVFVNGSQIGVDQVAALELTYRVPIPDGRYWYDRLSGAVGAEGGPCTGFIAAGMSLGGTMKANCSGGGTGVFINGREAHPIDVQALQRLLPVAPGRYWVDAMGNAGYEGGPALCNLVALARAQAPSGGGYGPMYEGGAIHSGPFGTVGGDGKTFYFSDGKSSVIVGD
jgi:hypothetical protein